MTETQTHVSDASEEGGEKILGPGCRLYRDDQGEEVIEVTLKHPIQAHGEERRVLVLREPTLKQLRFVNGVQPGPQLLGAYIAACASIPPSSADELRSTDAARCHPALRHFLPGVLQEMEG